MQTRWRACRITWNATSTHPSRGQTTSACWAWMNCWTRRVAEGACSMTNPNPIPSGGDFTTSEILAVMASRLLREGQVVFAGVGVPLLAATLAQGLRCPGLTILFEGGVLGPIINPGQLPPSTNEQRCTKRANMVMSSTEVLLLLQRGHV